MDLDICSIEFKVLLDGEPVLEWSDFVWDNGPNVGWYPPKVCMPSPTVR